MLRQHFGSFLLATTVLVPVGQSTEDEKAQPPSTPSIEEKVDVQLVQLNFIAVDGSGRPVTDLRAQEVEVRERGTKQTIAFLHRYEAHVQETQPVGTRDQPVAMRPLTSSRPGRYIVLAFDSDTSSPMTRLKSVQAAEHFIDHSLALEDRVSIVSFHGKLEIVQTFTRDAGLLKQACQRVLQGSDRATADRFSAIETLVDEMENCGAAGSGSNAFVVSCAQRVSAAYENDRFREARGFLYAWTVLTRSLAPIPQTKMVVLFSDGVSFTPHSDAFDVARVVLGLDVAQRISPDVGNKIKDAYETLAEAAASARVSFFTIHPGGAAGNRAISAAHGTSSLATSREGVDPFRRSEQNYQHGLAELARRTGGRATQGTDVAKQLQKAIDLSAGLYTVGYYLTGNARPSRHEVKVRVLRKGVRVETRREVPRSPMLRTLTGELSVRGDPCGDQPRRHIVLRLRLDRDRLSFERVGDKYSSDFAVHIRVLAPERDTPLFEDYRFLNVTNTADEIRDGNLPDPSIEQILLAPCAPLTVNVVTTDAVSGSRGEFSADIVP